MNLHSILIFIILWVALASFSFAQETKRKLIFYYQAPESVSMDRNASERAKFSFFAQSAETMEEIILYPNTISFELPLKPDQSGVQIFKKSGENEEDSFTPIASCKLGNAKSDYLIFLSPGSNREVTMKPFQISSDVIPEKAYCILNISAEELAFRCGSKKKILKRGQQMIFEMTESLPDAVRFLFATKKEERWKPVKSLLVSTNVKSSKLMLVSGGGKSLRLRTLNLSQPKSSHDVELQKKYNEPARHQE